MPPIRFLLTVVGLIATLHLYLAIRLVPDLPVSSAAQYAVLALLLLSTLLQPLGLLSRALSSEVWRDRLAWLGMGFMGFFSSLFVLSLLRDVMLVVAFVVDVSGLFELDFSALEAMSAVTCLALAAIVTAWGFINARRLARVVDVDVPIANLPVGLQGFRIAQISDVHVGPTIKRGYLARIVQAVEPAAARPRRHHWRSRGWSRQRSARARLAARHPASASRQLLRYRQSRVLLWRT
ncbi:MAG: hypothetical protein QM776_17610 [Rhodocyclaceae bacterium]